MSQQTRNTVPGEANSLGDRHLRIGWWALLAFLSLGLGLEALHGFKLGLYLDVSNETRRLLWRLAHAHGALLSLVNIAFGVTLRLVPEREDQRRELASRLHLAALVLLPLGFFSGGAVTYRGDPGPGIFLAPLGGLALFAAVFLTARGVTRA